MAVSPVEAVLGVLLIFVLPGFAMARALFPEWRFRGPEGLLHATETAALSLVGSVSATILGGFVLLNTPTGFQAGWGNPLLEGFLAAVTIVGLVAAGFRGAFSRVPPPAPPLEPSGGEEGAWELIREMDRMAREERRLLHAIRVAPATGPDRRKLEEELEGLRLHREELERARSEEYAK